MLNIFKLLGILGLILIISGVLIQKRNRKTRDYIYIVGGIFLTAYSYYIRDYIFITLQITFVIVTLYDLRRIHKS
jgi:Ca2+/Na+ antiporter